MTDLVDEATLTKLSREHLARTVPAGGTRDAGGHLVRACAIDAPGSTIGEAGTERARHERDAFARQVPHGTRTAAGRVRASAGDVTEGEVR
ncbi:hypothetical protein OG393_09610 [Streptomyces sp. NBC_01216]|uniref:hypothetical protein n=1 Tax=Streptomyces sp. NBC_01216 TaxID=2903778 RepID=UPI002E0F4DAD|nr:hypothetical protein OG393_09610 [Streptomyces sp. NBC_01216]